MKFASGRKNIVHLLQFIAFLLVFLLLFSCVSRVLRNKQYNTTLALYEEPRNSVDVLFMGSSHMLNAISPMQLWAQQGIVSVNYAQNGQVLPVTYYALQEALRYQSPKVIVLDIYKVIQDSLIDSKASLHYTLDNMSFGLPKVKAAFDLLERGERGEYLVDLVAYHSRWNQLTEQDIRPFHTVEKGAQALLHTESRGWFKPLPEEETAPPVEIALTYLEKIVDLCKEEEIELVMVATPFTVPEEDDLNRQQVVNAMSGYAEAWGVPYLNFMHKLDELGFSFDTDMADLYHVNWLGMEKTTTYLGEYLAEHYDLADHREDPAYAAWHEDYRAYEAYMAEAVPHSEPTP